MKKFLAKLRDVAKLKANWDGRKSAEVTEEAMATARILDLVPLGNGGLQLELHAGGVDLEIEIDPTGYVVSVAWTRAYRRHGWDRPPPQDLRG